MIGGFGHQNVVGKSGRLQAAAVEVEDSGS